MAEALSTLSRHDTSRVLRCSGLNVGRLAKLLAYLDSFGPIEEVVPVAAPQPDGSLSRSTMVFVVMATAEAAAKVESGSFVEVEPGVSVRIRPFVASHPPQPL